MSDGNDKGKARHGTRTEVNWDGGQGRQPYSNQEDVESPAAASDVAEGDRGVHSGTTLEQMEQAGSTDKKSP